MLYILAKMIQTSAENNIIVYIDKQITDLEEQFC